MSVFKLIDACCEAYDEEKFKQVAGTSHCNQAVDFICSKFGYSEFRGLLANQILDKLKSSSEWSMISLEKAQECANSGMLVVCAEYGELHGHVVVIRPGIANFSGKWNMKAPKGCNIGFHNNISQSINYDFKDIPFCFFWKGMKP